MSNLSDLKFIDFRERMNDKYTWKKNNAIT